MRPKEEEQVRVEQRIQQEESPNKGKQALIGIGSVALLLFLPTILEAAAGEKPWRR